MDDYQKEINTVKETRQTELELEKAKQKTLKDSQKLARANTPLTARTVAQALLCGAE